MVERPAEFNAFEFAVLAGLRAKQLAQGCTPRVGRSDKVAVTAQLEVAARRIVRAPAGAGGADVRLEPHAFARIL